jgi:hypothetical protein
LSWVLQLVEDGIIRRRFNYLTKVEADDGAIYWGNLYQGYSTQVYNDDPINDSSADSINSTYSAAKIEERLTEIPSGGVEEAPVDTKTYGRKDADWVEIILSGFSGTLDDIDEGTTNKHFTDTEKTKLSGIATGAEVNVQPDWNQATNTEDDYIKNKPTIPTISDTAYDETSWDGVTTIAPSKNAVRDVIRPIKINTDAIWNIFSGGANTITGDVVDSSIAVFFEGETMQISYADFLAQIASDLGL